MACFGYINVYKRICLIINMILSFILVKSTATSFRLKKYVQCYTKQPRCASFGTDEWKENFGSSILGDSLKIIDVYANIVYINNFCKLIF